MLKEKINKTCLMCIALVSMILTIAGCGMSKTKTHHILFRIVYPTAMTH